MGAKWQQEKPLQQEKQEGSILCKCKCGFPSLFLGSWMHCSRRCSVLSCLFLSFYLHCSWHLLCKVVISLLLKLSQRGVDHILLGMRKSRTRNYLTFPWTAKWGDSFQSYVKDNQTSNIDRMFLINVLVDDLWVEEQYCKENKNRRVRK